MRSSDWWQGENDSRWESLDFGDIEKSLAAKLTDDIVHMVLNCIDAKTRLKTLKMAGCVNITGIGLEPLRGSAVLELLDLSLVGQSEKPLDVSDPMLSEEVVIPILDSVICGSSCFHANGGRAGREIYRTNSSSNTRYCWRGGGTNAQSAKPFARGQQMKTQLDVALTLIGRVKTMDCKCSLATNAREPFAIRVKIMDSEINRF